MRHIGLSIWVVFMFAATTIARKAPISVTKQGNCPTFVTPDPPYPCAQPTNLCQQDCDCPGIEKCCRQTFCGGYKCGPPVPVSKPGQCPELVIPDPRRRPLCPIPLPKCNDDYDCPKDEKCCRTSICGGFECGPPVPVSKPGECPKLVIPDPRRRPLCPIPLPKCNDDYDCPKDEKCCRRSICGGFECGPPAQDNVCKIGTPQVTSSGEQVFCGRGLNREDCKAGYECNIDPLDRYAVCCQSATHKRRPKFCYLRSKVGPCDAMIPRWFYNKRTRKCEKFYYGGCDGNENNFLTAEECLKTCRPKCPRLECLKYIKCGHGIAIDENGCKTCGCIDPCQGVKCEPYQKCAVQVVQCFVAPCPPIGQCVDDPKGPCHVKLLEVLEASDPDHPMVGAFVPQCEDDGYYQPLQRWASTGNTWCVTREGEEIDGTRTSPGQSDAVCSRVPICGPVCDIYCEFGNVADENGCPTCTCNDDPCKVCGRRQKCVKKRVQCAATPCPSRVKCVDK